MKVKKIMTAEVEFCHTEDDLTKAAEIMWRRDCGGVPVIDGDMSVVGMITDRDISMAVCSRGQKPSEIKISEVIGEKAVTCAADENAQDALKKMRRKKIRRLPVVSQNGALVGILSITDVLLKDKKLKKKAFSTLRNISRPRPILLREVADETPED